MVSGPDPEGVHELIQKITDQTLPLLPKGTRILGPTDADIYRVKDMYREMLYFKTRDEVTLLESKLCFEENIGKLTDGKRYFVSFEEP